MDHRSREYEELRLQKTVAFAAARAETTGTELSSLEERIGDMLIRYDPDNYDLYSEMIVAEDRRDGLRELYGHCRRAVNSPYFGRVDFAEGGGSPQEYYIGRGGLYDEKAMAPVVVDWRTPVANLYYDGELGSAAYVSQERTYSGDMSLKRTYNIAKGLLNEYYDSDLITNDELLQAYLAKNADAVLKDIVATIQKDQNDIIRIEPFNDVIVQGVAGSGKTTVAMHRLAFLIFNYAKKMKPDQYAVIGTNRMFLSYVSGMLPDLGVESVTQMVMPELFLHFLCRDGQPAPLCKATAPERSSLAFFEALRDYMDALERDTLPREVTLFGTTLITEAEIRERILGGVQKPLLTRAELLSSYISQRAAKALPLLRQALERECDEALSRFKDGERGSYGSAAEIIDEKYEKLSALSAEAGELKKLGFRKAKLLKENRVYADFLRGRGLRASKKQDVYDLAALAYVAWRLRPIRSELRHIIVDEAQDFGPALYMCLTSVFSDATFTILGDVLQNIGDGVGITDWDEVLHSAFANRQNRFCVLSKSYRNTVEIAETANRVAARSGTAKYEAVPVVRHGKPVEFSDFDDIHALEDAAAAEALQWNGGSLALICPTAAAAKRLAARLPSAALILSGEEDVRYQGGVTVFDADSVKGLEFDRVLVCGAGAQDYPATPRDARLLYVVLTRALHELRVLTVRGSGGLLSDRQA